MFIARNNSGTIYGAWECEQYLGQEWLPPDDAELQAFLNRA